jgi:ATP-dependent Clp protease ATP-binding subunit ClpA/CheY-like chemotaxis protein
MDDAPLTTIPRNFAELLAQKIVGQPKALETIVPWIQMYLAGLSPVERPTGVFLLLGPTGTGKTRTVEAVAEVLHGDAHKVFRIDCGEYQSDHEVAKLIGSPPGYIGHRETTPLLTQERLHELSSDACELTIVLFDEIEKAAPSIARILLGILDKGVLRLGDNTEVHFDKTLIFFTSNLGARELMKEIQPSMGFRSGVANWDELAERLEQVALAAVRKMYSPEFVNRIDGVITYQPLNDAAVHTILDQQLKNLQEHVDSRLGERGFGISVTDEGRKFLVQRGTSAEYGARELKRTIYRYVTQPLSTMVIDGKITPASRVVATVAEDGQQLRFSISETEGARNLPRRRTLLIVDDNGDFLRLLCLHLEKATQWRLITAQSLAEADLLIAGQEIDFALLDFSLPDGNGAKLGQQLKQQNPAIQVIIMTGGELTLEEAELCKKEGFQSINKPFFGLDIVKLIEGRKQTANAGS